MGTTIDPLTLTRGQYVRFKCYHPTDQQTYEGKIVSISDYSVVKNMEGDLIPYYREVAKQIPGIAPYSTLQYLVLEYEQNANTLRIVRAAEWIVPESIVIYDPTASFDIRVYNLDKDKYGQKILDILKANGYLCNLVSTT